MSPAYALRGHLHRNQRFEEDRYACSRLRLTLFRLERSLTTSSWSLVWLPQPRSSCMEFRISITLRDCWQLSRHQPSFNSYVVANGLEHQQCAGLASQLSRASMVRITEPRWVRARLRIRCMTRSRQPFRLMRKSATASSGWACQVARCLVFDGSPSTDQIKIENREIIRNIHADQTRWDFMDFGSHKVVWGKTPQWFPQPLRSVGIPGL